MQSSARRPREHASREMSVCIFHGRKRNGAVRVGAEGEAEERRVTLPSGCPASASGRPAACSRPASSCWTRGSTGRWRRPAPSARLKHTENIKNNHQQYINTHTRCVHPSFPGHVTHGWHRAASEKHLKTATALSGGRGVNSAPPPPPTPLPLPPCASSSACSQMS